MSPLARRAPRARSSAPQRHAPTPARPPPAPPPPRARRATRARARAARPRGGVWRGRATRATAVRPPKRTESHASAPATRAAPARRWPQPGLPSQLRADDRLRRLGRGGRAPPGPVARDQTGRVVPPPAVAPFYRWPAPRTRGIPHLEAADREGVDARAPDHHPASPDRLRGAPGRGLLLGGAALGGEAAGRPRSPRRSPRRHSPPAASRPALGRTLGPPVKALPGPVSRSNEGVNPGYGVADREDAMRDHLLKPLPERALPGTSPLEDYFLAGPRRAVRTVDEPRRNALLADLRSQRRRARHSVAA